MKQHSTPFRPSRRTILSAAGISLAAGLSLSNASLAQTSQRPLRLAAIDWAMLETAIAIGHMPLAACELIRYRVDAVEPVIPDTVIDLGLRGAPNLELLQLIRPDLILTSPYYIQYEDRLAAISPVLNLSFYTPGEPPLPKIFSALYKLANAVNQPDAGYRAVTRADAELDQLAARLTSFSDRPVCLVNIGDSRHVRAFGEDSLFGSTLSRLGLKNAWTGDTRFSFLAPVPIEELVNIPETRLIIIGAIPPEAQRGLSRSILWHALPPVTEKRLYTLPDVNAFGAVPSALRFARLLVTALENGPVSDI